MLDRPNAVERAYQLARAGACASVGDIERKLRTEGYAEYRIIGPALRVALRALIKAARIPAE
jgi:hypothetical protein